MYAMALLDPEIYRVRGIDPSTNSANRRSLHYATPDFLLSLVALANLMRLSLTKAAHVAMPSASVLMTKAVGRHGSPLYAENGRRMGHPKPWLPVERRRVIPLPTRLRE